ncbi:MAG: ABC transporter substrate-binding protein [Paracoccaceae bacterium]
MCKLRAVTGKTHIMRQTERLKRGEINRRRFIMSALATGVTLPTATSLAQKAQAAQPKSGGVLRIGVASADRLADMQALATGNTLLEVTPDGALIGELAASFTATRAAQSWVFDLRSDVTFADGTPFDASHVIATLNATETPGLRGQIKAIRAERPDRVLIDLIRPNADFAWVLSDPALTIRAPSGAGTGVYLPRTEAGSPHARLHKRSDPWKIGRGHFEAVDLIPLPKPAARLTALLNDEVDLIEDVDPGMFALLAHSSEINVVENQAAALYGFARSHTASPDIGRALNDMTDRRDLAHKVLLGHGHARGSASKGPRPQTQTIRLAPPKDGFPGGQEMVSLVTQMGEKQGHTLRIDPYAPDLIAARQRLRPTFDWTLAEILAQHHDSQLETMIWQMRAAKNASEKAALQDQALNHLEDLGHVYPLIANDIHAHRAHLTTPQGTFDPLRIAERGWFA